MMIVSFVTCYYIYLIYSQFGVIYVCTAVGLRFQFASYTVTEGEEVSVCIVPEGDLETVVQVYIAASSTSECI